MKCIAFDFGGTLFSTAKMGDFTPEMMRVFADGVVRELQCSSEQAQQIFFAYKDAWKARRARAGDLPEKEISSLDLFRSALSEVGGELEASQIVSILNDFHSEESRQFAPLPGVVESLPKFVERGLRLCIVSNNPWAYSIISSLRRHGVESLFERIVVSCDVGVRKPHPQIFHEFLRQVQLPFSEILFVGDSFAHDIETPQCLGMKTCLVDFEGRNKNQQADFKDSADLFLTSFEDLLKY